VERSADKGKLGKAEQLGESGQLGKGSCRRPQAGIGQLGNSAEILGSSQEIVQGSWDRLGSVQKGSGKPRKGTGQQQGGYEQPWTTSDRDPGSEQKIWAASSKPGQRGAGSRSGESS
jgi:hypothetical protein